MFYIVSLVLAEVPITEPRLLYHDEVPTSIVMADALRCISAGASWHYPNGSLVDEFIGFMGNNYFQQLMLNADSRLQRNIAAPVPTEDDLDGLWTCRLRGNETGAIPVGIYQRGGGKYRSLLRKGGVGWGLNSLTET